MKRSEIKSKISDLKALLSKTTDTLEKDKINDQILGYKLRLRSIDLIKGKSKKRTGKIYVIDNPNIKPLKLSDFIKDNPDFAKNLNLKKKIKLTADYKTTISKEFEVDFNFNPENTNLDKIWLSSKLSNADNLNAVANLQLDSVCLSGEDDNKILIEN